MITVAYQPLKPGEHGEIFITTHKSGSHQARVRIRLLDGSATELSRSRKTAQEARLAIQAEIEVLLNASKGSADLKPDDKVGKAARQWIDELRVCSRWPNAPIRPQTVDDYERTLGNHVIPALGNVRLNQLTLPMCQKLVDDILEKGNKGPNDMVWTAEQVKFCFKLVIDRP
ncbi:MAG: tyrosine-type recombinase/integrase [Georgenia sp.]